MRMRLADPLEQAWRIVLGQAVYHPAAHDMRGPGPPRKLKQTRPLI